MSDANEEQHVVVINDEEQYAVWPTARALPDGWRDAGFHGTRDVCLDHIATVWTDMRPRSVRLHHAAGQLLVGLAAAQLAGQDHLVGLDRHRADVTGQALTPVPGLCSTTAAGMARRITGTQWAAVETGLAMVSARMLARLSAAPGRRCFRR